MLHSSQMAEVILQCYPIVLQSSKRKILFIGLRTALHSIILFLCGGDKTSKQRLSEKRDLVVNQACYLLVAGLAAKS